MFRTRAGRRAAAFIALVVVVAAGLVLYGFGGKPGASTGGTATIVIVSGDLFRVVRSESLDDVLSIAKTLKL